MSLVLVITVAILALAEAGYQYNTPSAIVLPGNKKANFHTGHVSQNIASINSGNVNSGYSQPSSIWGAYMKSGHTHHFRPAAGSNLSTGYTHAQSPSASTATHLNSAYANPFVPTISNYINSHHIKSSTLPASANFNAANPQNLAPSGIVDLNFFNPQTVLPAASYNRLQQNIGLNLSYPKSSNPLASANLNNGHTQNFIQTGTASLGQNIPVYSQSTVPFAAVSMNTGYPQVLTGATLNNAYAQKFIPFTASNLNSGYSQTLAPTRTSSLSNGYAENWIPSTNRNLSSGHSHSLSSGDLSQGYSQPVIPSATGNLNTGHSQSFSSGTSSSSQSYSEPLIPSATGFLNTGHSQSLIPYPGYSQVSSLYGSATVKTGYSQHFPSSAGVVSSSLAQTSTSAANVNSHSVQNLIPQSSSSSFGATTNNVQTAGLNIGVDRYSSPAALSNRVPMDVPSIVYKHIYFHGPPPEDVQQNVRPAPQQKKNYKILFIKVPSQEINLQQRAQIRNNASAAVEHKTLIYVLVKKPEPEQTVVVPNKTLSEHEVFFVKYNGNPLDLAAQVNGELNKSSSKSIAPLQPGLPNGQQ